MGAGTFVLCSYPHPTYKFLGALENPFHTAFASIESALDATFLTSLFDSLRPEKIEGA
jgi:hypothetical protein